MKQQKFIRRVTEFVESRSTGTDGEYTMCSGGNVTLYASCFAAMTLHYLGSLKTTGNKRLEKWVEYINRWQDPETGYFIGPEIVPGELRSPQHNWEHITMHLTAHALPALHVLGGRPKYPLRFAHRFLDRNTLQKWLEQRDWRQAWLEGNNLLFVGQSLIYIRDFENMRAAEDALETYFNWLDAEQDPATGLWGTNGFCDVFEALYGAYHQLLVYWYCKRTVRYARAIMDTVLSMQHADGSFTRSGGGGACEDVDAVYVLVNLYKRTGYKTETVRHALEKALRSILRNQMPCGGFINSRGKSFLQLGIAKTFVPVNTADMFATWFRVHTIAVICQVLWDHPLAEIQWRFNDICSMGWYDSETLERAQELKRCCKQDQVAWPRTFFRRMMCKVQRSIKSL